MKSTLEWIKSISEDAEEQISNLEDSVLEITQLEQGKRKKNF